MGGGVRSNTVASLQGASALALGTSTSREPEEEDESKTKSVRLPTWRRLEFVTSPVTLTPESYGLEARSVLFYRMATIMPSLISRS